MTRRILKWTIPVDDRHHPIGAGPVVHVATQHHEADVVQVWTDETGPGGGIVGRAWARVYATGQQLPEHDEVLGTALVLNGTLVWHVLRSSR